MGLIKPEILNDLLANSTKYGHFNVYPLPGMGSFWDSDGQPIGPVSQHEAIKGSAAKLLTMCGEVWYGKISENLQIYKKIGFAEAENFSKGIGSCEPGWVCFLFLHSSQRQDLKALLTLLYDPSVLRNPRAYFGNNIAKAKRTMSEDTILIGFSSPGFSNITLSCRQPLLESLVVEATGLTKLSLKIYQ